MTKINIAFEGIDGSGKSSAIKAVNEKFSHNDVHTTREPSHLWSGQKVTQMIRMEENALQTFFMFLVDREEHLDNLTIYDDRVCISDRFVDSTRAYQSVALTEAGVFDSKMDALKWINTVLYAGKHEPEYVFYFDVEPSVAVERSGGTDQYEKEEFLTDVSNMYEMMYNPHSLRYRPNAPEVIWIDANRPQEAVVSEVLWLVEEYVQNGDITEVSDDA